MVSGTVPLLKYHPFLFSLKDSKALLFPSKSKVLLFPKEFKVLSSPEKMAGFFGSIISRTLGHFQSFIHFLHFKVFEIFILHNAFSVLF